jgi:hypothetical protein
MSVKTREFKELMLIAKEFLKAVTGELDPWTKEKGEIKEDGYKAILLTPSHIQFARYGRGPGKKPPFEDILKWVKEEGIKFQGQTETGTAFAIQNSIGLNGTKNWVPNAPSFLDEAIEKHFKEYQIKLGQKLTVIINDEVNSIYKKIDMSKIM